MNPFACVPVPLTKELDLEIRPFPPRSPVILHFTSTVAFPFFPCFLSSHLTFPPVLVLFLFLSFHSFLFLAYLISLFHWPSLLFPLILCSLLLTSLSCFLLLPFLFLFPVVSHIFSSFSSLFCSCFLSLLPFLVTVHLIFSPLLLFFPFPLLFAPISIFSLLLFPVISFHLILFPLLGCSFPPTSLLLFHFSHLLSCHVHQPGWQWSQ